MSTSFPRVLSTRRGNEMELERDAFEKAQYLAVTKTVNQQEVPVKEKHARKLIMGTFRERGCGTFWRTALQTQIESHQVLSWKFCHVLHKLMRDGHSNVISDSLKFVTKLKDLGSHWSHIRQGYGQLIHKYCAVLVYKLEFHRRNQRIPGNLVLSRAELEAIGAQDVNEWFEMTVEMLDYVENILAMQRTVFDSLDMSRASSMTNTGQCRLAPLIILLLESNSLYDHIVRMMFKLHANLPLDVLDGHNVRFRSLFQELRKFYETCSNLQYFKFLVSVPSLPVEPPDFGRGGGDYVTPQMTLLARSDSEVQEDTLVDLASQQNGVVATPPPPPAEDPALKLQHQLDDAKMTMHRMQAQHGEVAERQQRRVAELEKELHDAHNYVEQLSGENERYRAQAETLQNERNQQQSEETQMRETEGKLGKMKEVYAKLREEHIVTLRTIADLRKQLDGEREGTEAKLGEREAEWRAETARLNDALAQACAAEAAVAQNIASAEKRLQALWNALCERSSELLAETHEMYETAAFQLASTSVEYALLRVQALEDRRRSLCDALSDCETAAPTPSLISALLTYVMNAQEVIILTKSLTGIADAELTAKLPGVIDELTQLSCTILSKLSDKETLNAGIEAAKSDLATKIDSLTIILNSGRGRTDADKAADSVDDEMTRMATAIEAAAQKIQAIMVKQREVHTGVRLKVNESILDGCNALMQAVLELVRRSKDLQQEIVAQGRASGVAPRDFYRRHAQWTDGLISASKAVGLAASVLVDSADSCMVGDGKFEALIVASQEVAASTAQLVLSSQVKAAADSACLSGLKAASRHVADATGKVVGQVRAEVESAATEMPDFSAMSLHQIKRREMESKVKVIELETKLQNERAQLAELKRKHYELAGPLEGWDETAKEE